MVSAEWFTVRYNETFMKAGNGLIWLGWWDTKSLCLTNYFNNTIELSETMSSMCVDIKVAYCVILANYKYDS